MKNNLLYKLNLQLFAEGDPDPEKDKKKPDEEDKDKKKKPEEDDPNKVDPNKGQPKPEDLIKALEEEVKTLKDDRVKDKAEIDNLRSENKALSSSVEGFKGELKKFKEAYEEQFNSGQVKTKTTKIDENKTYGSLTEEIMDAIH